MKAQDILKKYSEGERNFQAIDLNEANLNGANLSQADLNGANLSVANLSGSNLSGSNLSNSKLTVAKLVGANLSKANLSGANLNVANLTLADLSEAQLFQTSLVRAELTRSKLDGADLSGANLSGADAKDSKIRYANLTNANLSRADLRGTAFIGANLTHANLHGSDLSGSDFRGAELSNAELRQANLSRTHLQGANLSGANLRWADLSGADLSWADLSHAKLSGANLTGANLSYTNLLSTSLVHVDLTRANLIETDWAGADLSGATLTGAKLYGVLRSGVKTSGITCEWVDLSPNGDQRKIYRFSDDDPKTFFHETPSAVQVVVDAALTPDAHAVMATAYSQIAQQIAQQYPISFSPPNIRIGRRRTTLTFELAGDDRLFLICCIAILPFRDGTEAKKAAISLMQLIIRMIQSASEKSILQAFERFELLAGHLENTLEIIQSLHLLEAAPDQLKTLPFFRVPTRTTLINSSNQPLDVYSHPLFGKRSIETPDLSVPQMPLRAQTYHLPTLRTVVDFVQGFQLISPL